MSFSEKEKPKKHDKLKKCMFCLGSGRSRIRCSYGPHASCDICGARTRENPLKYARLAGRTLTCGTLPAQPSVQSSSARFARKESERSLWRAPRRIRNGGGRDSTGNSESDP